MFEEFDVKERIDRMVFLKNKESQKNSYTLHTHKLFKPFKLFKLFKL